MRCVVRIENQIQFKCQRTLVTLKWNTELWSPAAIQQRRPTRTVLRLQSATLIEQVFIWGKLLIENVIINFCPNSVRVEVQTNERTDGARAEVVTEDKRLVGTG